MRVSPFCVRLRTVAVARALVLRAFCAVPAAERSPPSPTACRPGVVTVHKELDKTVEKYFVSGGFAFVHPDSTADICAVEAVKVTDLDPDAVRAGLQVCVRAGGGVWGEAD